MINLKKIRQARGLTQEGLAYFADISYNTLIKIERGGIKDPRVSTALSLARVLNVTVEELCGEY